MSQKLSALTAALFVLVGAATSQATSSAQSPWSKVEAAFTPAPQLDLAETTVAATRATGRSVIALSTAYNSLAAQTDSTPHITATGTRTRPGVVALSRDLLRVFPYGTRVTIQDLSGKYNFSGRVFIVEDTMHQRKTNQVDVWMPSYREAINYGRRQVRITALR